MTKRTLLNARERKERIAEKTRIVLGFLRDETWTDISVVRELLGFSSAQAAYQTMAKLERSGVVKRAEIQVSYGRPLTIWGITEMGLHYAFELDEPLQDRKVFEPSKVKPIVMQHKIDLQVARLKAEKKGWSDWVAGELLGKRIKCSKYPDAVSLDSSGTRIAIELERTIKSRKRYAEILVSHLVQRKKGDWDKIFYLSPDMDLSARIKRAFKSIKQATYNGEKFAVTEDHLSPFHFYSFNEDDWLSNGGC
ncbi:MAG: hypothetical protein B6D73_10760 [gamma proteobacterium symbiont of Stewartia floridana]|nr:MAG: hypothetical protein B6D73_10760 [gamma proteobacterium symbiont of Stewartia floridana]